VPVTTVIPSAIGTRVGSSTKTGWTVGAGVEYAFTYNWTVKAEYLFEDFGHVANTAPGFVLPGVAAVVNNHNRDVQINIVRVGVNYKFW
jgi:outer membrane immunogenic protein